MCSNFIYHHSTTIYPSWTSIRISSLVDAPERAVKDSLYSLLAFPIYHAITRSKSFAPGAKKLITRGLPNTPILMELTSAPHFVIYFCSHTQILLCPNHRIFTSQKYLDSKFTNRAPTIDYGTQTRRKQSRHRLVKKRGQTAAERMGVVVLSSK